MYLQNLHTLQAGLQKSYQILFTLPSIWVGIDHYHLYEILLGLSLMRSCQRYSKGIYRTSNAMFLLVSSVMQVSPRAREPRALFQ